LNDVVVNVDELNTMVTEITVASHEQSQGVNEITKAMNELDQTTHANATTSQQVSGYANSLSDESTHMNEMVTALVGVVLGEGSSKEVSREKHSAPKVVALRRETKAHENEPPATKLKKASGDMMPDSNDPRFKDV
jgi:methyl-accepting chemotaxis protein